jgi:predicted transcriptional regulator
MSKRQYTIELPPAIGRRVDRTARKQRRKPSEIAVEAIEQYFTLSGIQEEIPTPAEMRAIRRGEAALKLGDSISLDELRRKEEVAPRPRRTRAKVS